LASANSNFSTIYAALSDDQLYCLFTDASWPSMDSDKRLAALQEVECRMARRQGRPACPITAVQMPANSMGAYDGDGITLNASLLKSPRTLFGKIRPYGGIAALETVIHEGRHAFQRAAICGKTTAKVPDKLRRAWLVNTMGYMNGNGPAGFAFYAFQPMERDARSFAAREMSAIYRCIMHATGKSDPLFEKGLEQMRREKEMEYRHARAKLSDEAISAQMAALKVKIGLNVGLNLSFAAFGESVSFADCMRECGVSTDMLDDLADHQMDDHRAILCGEKQLDHYMDGMLGEAMNEELDWRENADSGPGDSPEDGKVETLDELVARLFAKPMDTSSFADSARVRPDGSRYGF